MVPLFDIKAQHQAIEPELMAAFQRVLRSGHFILGPEVQEFETHVAQWLGARHAIGVSSGTDAILLALMTLGIGPGDEVLCPAFTFFATAGCIARVGATPVFVDAAPGCFNIDPADARRKVTDRTKAIIPVHLFGQAADMDAIMELARARNIAVVEDAAQALGAEYRGRKAGAIGDFGTFSFFPTKNLGACGDAGLLVTNDDALAERARLLRTHGAKQKYYHELVGANFRLDALQAALLSVKLPHFSSYTAKRRENAAFYTDQLSKLPGVTAGGGAGESEGGTASTLVLPVAYPHNFHIWNQYTLLVGGAGRRDALRQYLAQRGIGAEVYYPVALHQQPCFKPASGAVPVLPVAETLARQCLSIPIYPELEREQLQEVSGAIADFVGNRG